jgi:hypothetical protein
MPYALCSISLSIEIMYGYANSPFESQTYHYLGSITY